MGCQGQTPLGNLHLAVVRARKRKDDESGLLFPVSAQHEKRDTYPWHQLQLPRPRSGGAVTGGGSGRPAAPIFTPPTTQEGARKKETRKRLTKSWVCE